jgi:hypothetical protein
MNRNSQISTALSAFILATAFAVGAAYAQVDNPPKSSTSTPETHEHQHSMTTASKSNVTGEHDMPATVTSVDQKTGMVGLESEGMKLKVHFPTNTIADLKKGDKINLHLGYSKQ